MTPKVGQRVRFRYSGGEQVGIVRGYRGVEWDDLPALVVDIDPPLRGPIAGSQRIVPQDRVIEIVGEVIR